MICGIQVSIRDTWQVFIIRIFSSVRFNAVSPATLAAYSGKIARVKVDWKITDLVSVYENSNKSPRHNYECVGFIFYCRVTTVLVNRSLMSMPGFMSISFEYVQKCRWRLGVVCLWLKVVYESISFLF